MCRVGMNDTQPVQLTFSSGEHGNKTGYVPDRMTVGSCRRFPPDVVKADATASAALTMLDMDR